MCDLYDTHLDGGVRSTCCTAADVIRHRKLQQSASKHLKQGLSQAASCLEQVHVGVAWAPPPTLSWITQTGEEDLPPCPRSCSSPTRKTCRSWTRRQLRGVLSPKGEAVESACPSGARHWWQALRVDNLCLGVIQAAIAPAADRVDPEHFARAISLLAMTVESICQRIRASEAEARSRRLARRLSAHQKTEKLLRFELHRVQAGAEPPPPPGESPSRRLISGIVERLQSNYALPLTLGNLAAEAGLSVSHLSAEFSKCVGMPFRSYLKKIRLDKAEALLHDPRLQIAEVAQSVGYADPNHFRQDFKRRTGLSPTAWRRTVLVPKSQ